LNTVLQQRTGLPSFDFDRPDERAAMGHLLYLIVERNLPMTGLMISALVVYLGANDAGTGFYGLAKQLALLPTSASRAEQEAFWINQVNAIHGHYAGRVGSATP
jgi:hypothetical protein